MGNILSKRKREALELEATELLEQSITIIDNANAQLIKLKHLLDKLGVRDYTTNCVGETVIFSLPAKEYERVQYNKFVEEFKSYQDAPVDTQEFDKSD